MDLHDSGSVVFEALQTETIEWLEGVDIRGGLQKTLDQATAVLAAEMMGTAREALERTVTFLGEREQFDVKLGTFQALQHRCAQMYCELELADSAVAAALVALDHDAQNTSSLVSSAKALANDCLTLISSESVQLHGGMGVTEEMDMGLFLKRSRVCNQLLGSSSYHRDRYARLNGF
jgi:alkylation response protein AidB-like acyl-CoA dehydrogenase